MDITFVTTGMSVYAYMFRVCATGDLEIRSMARGRPSSWEGFSMPSLEPGRNRFAVTRRIEREH